MKQLLARVRRAVAQRITTARAFRPDYADERQWRAFAQSPAAMGEHALATAVRLGARREFDEAARLAVTYFGRRSSVRFFADPRMSWNRRDPVLSQSVAHAALFSRRATTVGLSVYNRVGPPLRPGFPWSNAVGLRKQDLLFGVHPHRFAFLPPLALATAAGGEPHAPLVALLDDWMRFSQSNPELPFCSNLVVIERLIATTWAFAFLGIAEAEHGARWRLLAILGQDIAFLVPRLGDAYPNNHLLLDRFAAWYIALLLPEWLATEARVDDAEREWLAELARQTYEDGGSVEHSTYYHGLAAEMAAAYLLLAEVNHRAVPPSARQRIGRMLDLQSALCGNDGNAVQIGDSSDDSLFPLDGVAGGNAAALREIGRELFARRHASLDDRLPGRTRAWWLLGGNHQRKDADHTDEGARCTLLDRGGIAVFSDSRQATRCTFRLGPMTGTSYLAGHQHADALSVTVTHRGVPLVVDSGTCTYRFSKPDAKPDEPNWRAYFAGSGAHNGLVVGNEDPFGRMRGDFRASDRLPEVDLVASSAGRHLAFHEARLVAFRPFPDWSRGVVHLQGVGIIVYDIVGGGATDVSRHFAFQCAAHCEVDRMAERELDLRAEDRRLRLAWSAGLGHAEIVSGRELPTNGWVSPAYGERLAAAQILVPIVHASGLTAFAFSEEKSTSALRIECEVPARCARLLRLVRHDGIDLVLVNAGSVDEPVVADGVTFEGRLAWIRIRGRERPAIHWLEGRSLAAPRWSLRRAFAEVVPDFVG